jgi:nucleotide-binding universal stress UspA family protein
MFQSCLICTDFSDSLQRLRCFVPSLADGGFQRIIFCHIVPFSEEGQMPRVNEEERAKAKILLDRALIDIPEEVEVIVAIECGRPLDIIPRLLTEHSIQVLFLGTPVRSLLAEKFFGSTTRGLLQQIKTPTAIFRPQLLETYTQEELTLRCRHLWRCLLVPYNDSEEARYSIECIKQKAILAQDKASKQIILCWVVETARRSPEVETSYLEQARQKLDLLKQELTQLGLSVTIEIRQGNPISEVLAVAATHNVSSIVLGSKTHSRWLQQTILSFAGDLLRQSWFPILLFPLT